MLIILIKRVLFCFLLANSVWFVQADIIIGVAGPHTGAYASFGEQLWKGAEKAAEDINAKGGINGEMVQLVKADDVCEPKTATLVANRLVDSDGAIAVIGHFCSSSSIPASRVYAKAGVMMVTPSSTNPALTDQGLSNVFRVCGRDDQQGAVAAHHIVNKLQAKRVAILHDNDIYGQGLADAMKATLNALNVKEVMYEGLPQSGNVDQTLISQLLLADAEVVYFGGLYSEAGSLLRELREKGSRAIFVSGDGIVSNEFTSAVGSLEHVNGVLMTFGANPALYDSSREVIQAFRDRGYEPESYTLYSYAAMQVIGAALSHNNGDPVVGAKWLKSHSVKTIIGEKSFDYKGDLTSSDYVMYEWNRQGKYAQIH